MRAIFFGIQALIRAGETACPTNTGAFSPMPEKAINYPSRRDLLAASAGALVFPRLAHAEIARSRHNPVLRTVDRLNPLSVGNGHFAVTVDVTGPSTPGTYRHQTPIAGP